jgi:hypothetical protein
MRWALVALMPALALIIACGGTAATRDARSTPDAPGPTVAMAPTSPAQLGMSPRAVEADADPSLPGEYINLPQIYGGFYGNRNGPNTAAHLRGPIDYSTQGLPPAGGPHWGSTPCPDDPAQAPSNCGPVPWGVYRTPWPAESLVHNMEHAGVVIWYNTSDQRVIDKLEALTRAQLAKGHSIVLVPYPDMTPEHIALTAWSRRDEFPVSDYDPDRVTHFIDVYFCRFDPEALCSFRI